MRQSELFTKPRKDAPKDEISKSASLLIRAGYIDKLHSGVYTYLPLGLRVLKNIENIIREEINSLGAQELLLPSLHPKENWEKTGRWSAMDDLYKVTDSSGREFALAGTHEEVIVPLMKQFISSYKDLPVAVFQIQNKFRMELRAKSGILRGREFIMKDLYSFHADEGNLGAFYERAKDAYISIFKRAGIGERTHFTYASGGSFSKYSHEFQTVTEAGEDTIHICMKCGVAINDEVKKEHDVCSDCGMAEFKKEKAIEVGNIFKLKTKYSEPFDLTFKNERGENEKVLMGCYGIGLGRLMGAVAEVCADDKGLAWPDALAPFRYHMLLLGADAGTKRFAEELYTEFGKKNIPVLYDDREGVSAGEKFSVADLVGIPTRIVVSDTTVAKGMVEVKKRGEDATKLVLGPDLLRM